MPDDDGVEVMCTISLSPLNAATLRQRLDEIGDSVIMSQVGSAADPDGNYRWRVHVHVPTPGPAVETDPFPRRTRRHLRQRTAPCRAIRKPDASELQRA